MHNILFFCLKKDVPDPWCGRISCLAGFLWQGISRFFNF